MADLERFGETWVEPARLFDPADRSGGPPADALDVQFRAPLSFSAFVDDLFATGRDSDGRACFTLYEQVIDRTVEQLQQVGGFVLDEEHVSVPARLDLAAYGEATVPGIDGVRMHHHLYVGTTGVSVRDDRRLPVDAHRLGRAIRGSVLPLYGRALQDLTTDRFGCHTATHHHSKLSYSTSTSNPEKSTTQARRTTPPNPNPDNGTFGCGVRPPTRSPGRRYPTANAAGYKNEESVCPTSDPGPGSRPAPPHRKAVP